MYNTQPLVSICIPVYNGERYLKECLTSVVNQSYRNIEIVLVDDCSTDQSLSIASSVLAEFPHRKIYQNDRNMGLVQNWSMCIEKAKGEWIKFLFQDDQMEPDCIETMLNEAISHNVPFVFCAREFIFEKEVSDKIKNKYLIELTKPEDLFPKKTKLTPEEIRQQISPFLSQNIIGEPVCWLIQKKLIADTGGFNLRLKMFVDYEFALRVILNNSSVFIGKKLIKFRVHILSASIRHELGDAEKEKPTKQLQASGDVLELINQYIQNPDLSAFLIYWQKRQLKIYFIYFYLRLCKEYGISVVRDVLADIVKLSTWKNRLSYSRLRYEYMKILFKIRVLPYLNKHN